MPDLVLRSERQVQTQILSTLQAELGLNDINPGSVLDILTQAVAQEDFALYFQIAQLSRLNRLDSLRGNDLDLRGFEFGINRFLAERATGLINILRPDGFVRVSTTFFSGANAPLAGDTEIQVNDASNALFGTSGTLIIGRGTNNEEEVTYSTAPVNNTSFFTITLDAPGLANDHAIEETIILRQGNDETIVAGTRVVVPATGTRAEVQFTIDDDVVLLAGEASIDNVNVTAVDVGTDGNIGVGAIRGTQAFLTPPFIGARAENTSAFTSGRSRESDDAYRDRIREAIPALTRGIRQAISNAIVGLVDPVSARRVVSANIVLPVDECGAVLVYIDDGTGLEPTFLSIGFETVRARSTGGEQRLQIDEFPIAKAQVENNLPEFYDMSAGPLTLIYEVGVISETITFNPGDFRTPEVATAEEITAVINDRSTLLEARTSQGGRNVVINAIADVNENIQVTGGTSNAILGFPLDRRETLNLYIDDVLQSKDGAEAILNSGNISAFNLQAIGAYPHTLQVVVDGKTANSQTATVALADVTDPAAVTAQEIVAVLNRDLVGVVATAVNNNSIVRLSSNTGRSSAAQLQITGGTLNDATNGLNFPTTVSAGLNNDYIFNRELGLVQLNAPLGPDQTVTVGSLFTRARLRAANAELYAPADTQTLVISVDGGADQTITFDATFAGGLTAVATAAFINLQLQGATAIVREIGGINFLEINSNTYATSGTIEIKSASTANAAFAFPVDQVATSGSPNQAFLVSGAAGPYEFAEGDSLVVVVDNDIVNGTFNVPMNFGATVTVPTSATNFTATDLSPIFLQASDLTDFFIAFTSGANTTTSDIVTVADQGSGVFRYTFGTVPADLGDFAAGDLISITGLADSVNNGNFVIQAVGASFVDIQNIDGVNASLQTGSARLSLRRQISSYVVGTGALTTSAFRATPTAADPFVVIPTTVANMVSYVANPRISSFNSRAIVEGVENFTRIQISSRANGSDGFIQVTGGGANTALQFSTAAIRGIQGYSYFTGLIDLVHRTIYGDDADLVSSPGVGAAGVVFRILAPTTIEVNVQLDLILSEGVSIASVENEVRSAVSNYINNLGVGEDVVIEEVRSAVIRLAGIVDVVLQEPAANIAIADNELARVRDPNILIG